MKRISILLVGLLSSMPLIAQENLPGNSRISDSVLASLSALGASNGVPDGLGVDWTSKQRVRNQNASLSLFTTQAGLSVPIYESQGDQLFALASTRWMNAATTAILPTDGVRMPNNWYDIQAGGLFIRDLGDGWSWGASLTAGSISDRPFDSFNEISVNALAFLRKPSEGDNAWLFYVVSATNGQIGRNIPIPGLAYEFKTTDWKGMVGFPFVNLAYRPAGDWGWEFNYAALTDVMTRVNYFPSNVSKLYTGFSWTNQAWFRADRPDRNEQFFYYEKRFETGLSVSPLQGINFDLAGGYAFDRHFFETSSFALTGRNGINVRPGPFMRVQLEIKY